MVNPANQPIINIQKWKTAKVKAILKEFFICNLFNEIPLETATAKTSKDNAIATTK